MLTSTVKNLGKYSVDLDEIWEGKKKQQGIYCFLENRKPAIFLPKSRKQRIVW